jgi:hypothetical protein
MVRKVWLAINIILAALGGILAFASEFISLLPEKTLPWSTNTIQLYGLALFMLSVFLYMITSQIETIRKESTKPKLFLGTLSTEFKHAFKNKEEIGAWYFAVVTVENKPEDWNNGQSAEKATAELIFTNQGSMINKIEYGRWWDKDIPLFPIKIPDVKSLKQIDIDPGHPESLVLAFRKAGGKDIFAFYYIDHKNIENLYGERIIGKPPVEITIRLRGHFRPKEFRRILDLDSKGDFIFIEKPSRIGELFQALKKLRKQGGKPYTKKK